jgi:hypothetical protein
MQMSATQRQKFLEDTKDQGIALLEDFSHFREILARPNPFRGELRRVSAALRRLLIERSIAMVAGPRIGRFLFLTSDNKHSNFTRVIVYIQGGAPWGTEPGQTPLPLDLQPRRDDRELKQRRAARCCKCSKQIPFAALGHQERRRCCS